jgi:hypothetical protein
MNGIRKVGGHEIRLNRPFRGVPKILTFSITGTHQNTARAGTPGKLDVAVPISDDERSLQIDGVFAGCHFEHSRVWLAAIATVDERVRTIVYGVKPGASGFELLSHDFVDGVNK